MQDYEEEGEYEEGMVSINYQAKKTAGALSMAHLVSQ